jgi:hypothetical protein
VGKPGFYVAVYKNLGKHKVGVLEDTLMGEKEERERSGRLREASRGSAAGSTRTPPIGARASGNLIGILNGSRKEILRSWGDVKLDVNLPAKLVGDTLTGTSGGRDSLATVGGLFSIWSWKDWMPLKWMNLEESRMKFWWLRCELLLKTRYRTVEKKLWGAIRRMSIIFSGRGTHNPADPELIAGAIIVYLGQEVDEMILGYTVTVHGDGKGSPPFYTAYLEGFEKTGWTTLDISCGGSRWSPPLFPSQYYPTLLPGPPKPERTEKGKKEYIKQMSEMTKIMIMIFI